ncbi:MAG: hypothetical protein LBV53_01675 [Mycoplasmataceae bacterium]|jgi:hypothetical protein|nr:hypothetical protein [Mycoplasmataceae bacterium]
MKKEKTIKITEFGMKPELVGAIIKYITMIATTVHNSNPIPRKPQQPKAKRMTLTDIVIEMREGFKRIDEILKRNNIK